MVLSKLPQNLFGQFLSHVQACFIDRNAIHDTIGAGKVDIFKDAGCMGWILGHHFGMTVALHVDKDGFSRLDVAVVSSEMNEWNDA